MRVCRLGITAATMHCLSPHLLLHGQGALLHSLLDGRLLAAGARACTGRGMCKGMCMRLRHEDIEVVHTEAWA